jgi:putative spermidine/putrescine transport system substrate-binding protein
VLEESWNGGIGVLQAKVKAGNPNWDVVQVEADELALGCEDGLFEKINWDRLGGKNGFISLAVSDCGVGAFLWSTAIAYDAAKIANGPGSWMDFWDLLKFPGKRALRKGPKYTLEFALLADGVPADHIYEALSTREGLDRAFAKLDELKPHLIWWETGAQPLQLLASGEVTMTSAYNGRVTGINRTENRKFQIVWFGSIYAVDSWVILKGAENRAVGEDFIVFASQTENLSKLPRFVAYGLPKPEATKAVPSALQADLPTSSKNLEKAIPLNVDFWIDNSEALTARFNAWLAR